MKITKTNLIAVLVGITPALILIGLLMLGGCATNESPEAAAARAQRMAIAYELAKARYCAMPLETRQAMRDKATGGLQVVVCPQDKPAQ